MQTTCKKTQRSFEITDMELRLFEKMGLQKPLFHPKIRAAMRLAFRNERNLYMRKCSLSGERIMSAYSENHPFPVYKYDYWMDDKWDLPSLDYDFDKPFFEQYKQLSKITPRPNLFAPYNENCDYCNAAEKNKNCFMHILSDRSEDCMYTHGIFTSRDCVDCAYIYNGELSYECTDCRDIYHCRMCFLCDNSSDLSFCFDCRGCSNCFMCYGLRNQKYCINNQQLSEEEYKKKMEQVILTSYHVWNQITQKFLSQIVSQQEYVRMINTENSDGNFLINTKNCHNCFDVEDSEDCMNVVVGANGLRDVIDTHAVVDGSELIYNNVSTTESYNCHNVIGCWTTKNSCYGEFLQGCQNCMGCISLRYKKYCILNKQYPKEEYEKIRAHIIQELGDYFGNPFPFHLAPFNYQDSAFRDHYTMSKEEVEYIGWCFGQPEEVKAGNFKSTSELPDSITNAPKDLPDTYLCEKSGKPFKIIPQEICLLKKIGVPLPRFHHDVRFKERVKFRKMK